MKTPLFSILCFVAASLLGAAGQFLYKSGAERTTEAWTSYLNPRLLTGVLTYIGVMALFVVAFKRGGALSVLYPIYATTFIWAALIGWLAYGETIRPVNVVGMAMLIGGMFLMGVKSS